MQRSLPLPLSYASARRLSGVNLTHPVIAVGVLVVGLVLRGLLLDRPGLHPDEALYASWALRIASADDPALLGVYVDKPPLLLYLLAGLFRLAGFDGSTALDPDRLILAGRLAALLASTASLALLWLVARRVHGPRVALAALALFACSPLAVRLSPTLFTDPWLTLWLLLGLWAALTQRAWLAGIACGLAYATKQQGLLLAPLILAVLWLAAQPSPAISLRRQQWRSLNGFALVAVVVLWWDSLRWQWLPSYWDRSAQTYGGLVLAVNSELPQRLRQWGELLGYGFGWPLWLALGAVLLWALIKKVGRNDFGRPARPTTEVVVANHAMLHTASPLPAPLDRRWFDALVLVYVVGYLVLHLLTNLAAWDRYLLPLIPLLALLLARGALWAWDEALAWTAAGHASWGRRVAASALAVGLVYAGYTAAWTRLPLADGGAYDGVQQVTQHVRAVEPAGAILYHHWLGWHYNFYFFDAPVDLRWWQDPVDLARKAAASAGQRQLIAFPAGRDRTGAQAALARAGLALSPVLVAADAQGGPSVTLYSIEPVGAGALSYGR